MKINFRPKVITADGCVLQFMPGEVCLDDNKFVDIDIFVLGREKAAQKHQLNKTLTSVVPKDTSKLRVPLYIIYERICPVDNGIWIYSIEIRKGKSENKRMVLIPWNYIMSYALYDRDQDKDFKVGFGTSIDQY
jgi:hypothetical protein